MPTTPAPGEVRQLLVHPAVWPHLVAWLGGRSIDVNAMDPDAELPTYVMSPPLTPRQDAAVRPLETPAGTDADTEALEGDTGAQAGTGRLRALLRNAVSTVLREEGEHVPLSVRTAAGDAALARLDAWRAPASDTDQAARWSRREYLGVLLSRMERGRILDTERPLLRAAVETELADAEQAHAGSQRMADLVTASEKTRQRLTADADRYEAGLRADLAEARDERDRARSIAERLEQELAAIPDLLERSYPDDPGTETILDHLRGEVAWPCETEEDQ